MKLAVALLTTCILFFTIKLSSQVSFTIVPQICSGDTIHLTANTGTLSNCTYTWFSFPVGVSFSSPNTSVTGLSVQNSGTYTIALNITSASVTSSFQNTLSAVSLPTITLAQNNLTTCITSNLPLFSNPVHLTASGGTSYTWNPPPLPSMTGNPNGPTDDVRPPSTTCFSVTGQNANGCRSKSVACVIVIPRYSIGVIATNTFICASLDGGEMAILNATNPSSFAIGLPSSYTYSWTTSLIGGILTTPFSSEVFVSPSTSTTYTLEMKDSIQCVSLPEMVAITVENCSGLKIDQSDKMIVEFFPNPFKDDLTVYIGNLPTGDSKIVVYNSLGQIVFIKNEVISKNVMYLNELPPGIYYLKIQDSFSKKIIKY